MKVANSSTIVVSLLLVAIAGLMFLITRPVDSTKMPSKKISWLDDQQVRGASLPQNWVDHYRLQGNKKPPRPEGNRWEVFTAACFNDEQIYLEQLELGLLVPETKLWRDQRRSNINTVMKGLTAIAGPAVELTPSISHRQWESSSLPQSVTSYLQDFSRIHSVEMKTTGFHSGEQMRDAVFSMDAVDLFVNIDVRGLARNKLRNDRFQSKVRVKKMAGKWQVMEWEILRGETLTGTSPSFVDATKSSGLQLASSYLRREAIRRGGYGMAVADYNGDGNLDLYVGHSGPAQLFMGTNSGKFELANAPGPVGATLVKSAAFADFDNDKHLDLAVVRFIQPTKPANPAHRRTAVQIYRNNSGHSFEPWSDIQTDGDVYAMPAAIADFDKNGLLDLYVGYPGVKDFTHLGEVNRNEGKRIQSLFFNHGDGKFVDTDRLDKLGARSNIGAQNLFPHSAVALDFDSDGDSDILVIDDRGLLSPVYQNLGNGNFAQVADTIGLGNYAYGMAASAADFDGDGHLDIIMTNVESTAGHRIRRSCHWNWGQMPQTIHTSGLRVFRGLGQGRFSEIKAEDIGLSNYGDGLAGVAFIDYNNDGLQDLYITNGLWSGTAEGNEVSSYFVRAAHFGNLGYKPALAFPAQNQTQSSFMNMLISHRGGILSAGKESLSLSGYQRNRLYLNKGNGKFVEVGYLEGVDSIADGYMVSVSDYNADGRQDLILRNADPGIDKSQFPTLQLFENRHPQFRSLQIELAGVVSNSQGIGAKVSVYADSGTKTQEVIAVNGTVQSEPIVHFGLGAKDKVNRLEIKWPTGQVDIHKGLKPGRYKLEENVDKRQISLAQ